MLPEVSMQRWEAGARSEVALLTAAWSSIPPKLAMKLQMAQEASVLVVLQHLVETERN